MIHKKFKIENCKGIKNTSIDLENNRIVTLVGLNESGKTTIMEAIELYYQMIKGEEPEVSELNKLRPKGIDFTGKIRLEGTLEFEKTDIDKIQQYWNRIRGRNQSRTLEIEEEFTYFFEFNYRLHEYERTRRAVICDLYLKGRKTNLHKNDNPKWQSVISYIKEELVPEILYYDDFIFQIPEKICFEKPVPAEPNLKVAKSAINESWKLVVDDILKCVNLFFY